MGTEYESRWHQAPLNEPARKKAKTDPKSNPRRPGTMSSMAMAFERYHGIILLQKRSVQVRSSMDEVYAVLTKFVYTRREFNQEKKIKAGFFF